VSDGLNRQVNVKVRPVETIRAWRFDMDDLVDRRLAEPGKLRRGQEQFFVVA
jgi:hypothetical protein